MSSGSLRGAVTEAKPRASGVVDDHPLEFLRGFLERPREVGSVVPSSRFLKRRIVRCAALDRARVVVELGPGTGGTTRALLAALAPDAHLLAIEISPRFAAMLRENLCDPRLIVEQTEAREIQNLLTLHGLPAPDAIVSGIPFSTMAAERGTDVLRAIRASLAPGGRFVAYQLRDRVESLGREIFGPARVETELINIPPMRVYRWIRPDGAGST